MWWVFPMATCRYNFARWYRNCNVITQPVIKQEGLSYPHAHTITLLHSSICPYHYPFSIHPHSHNINLIHSSICPYHYLYPFIYHLPHPFVHMPIPFTPSICPHAHTIYPIHSSTCPYHFNPPFFCESISISHSSTSLPYMYILIHHSIMYIYVQLSNYIYYHSLLQDLLRQNENSIIWALNDL